MRYSTRLVLLVISAWFLTGCAILVERLSGQTNDVPVVVVTNTPVPPVVTPAPQPPPPPVVTDYAVFRILGVSGRDLRFTLTGTENWPSREDRGKRIIGKLMMKSSQMAKYEFVDSVSTGNIKSGRKTLENAFGVGEHSLDVNTGEEVSAYVISNDGKKKSTVETWVWPLPST